MNDARKLSMGELDAGLGVMCPSPQETGTLEMIVRRPRVNEREVLQEGRLDPAEGLVGDTWCSRGSSRTADGSSHVDMQLTLMNSRIAALVAQTQERWPLAGDQLFVDLDLSATNLPPGTRLTLGSAVIEVTSQPHTGCQKFSARFGPDALKFVNSPARKELQFRGIYAKVVHSGVIRVGDTVKKKRPE